MNQLQKQIAGLPTVTLSRQAYLSCQAVTDGVAAVLFPALSPDQIDETSYQRILETADTLCRQLGYQAVVKLTPPAVPLADMGLYWTAVPTPGPSPVSEADVIHVGSGWVEMVQDGLLLAAGHPADASLSQLGLDEVTRQHFKIPVTASAGVIDLVHRAVASDYLYICLADEAKPPTLFALGQVVMTPGAADLGVDFTPYLTRHAAADWGELDAFDKRQNDTAVKEGCRILSAYDVPTGNGEMERIWIITEADVRHVTVCGIALKVSQVIHSVPVTSAY
jgi:hypothetical protein